MAYKALYRKYRPETFDDMVGQKHIITTLKNAIENNKIAHAYIFSGPRGTGKTTTAKILAKALNCTSENKPCNECENCKAINNNSFADIVEIDAASNNGVDDVRDLIEKVKFAPIQGKYKVYIIDEVHMMTPGAFNALLKTLEEPPEHVIFILATTDVHKVLPTILSRCQRFDFSKISYDDIVSKLIEILKKEGITFEEKVPLLVAELADGGMRDALSILDQVLSYAGKNVTLQHVYDVYGLMSSQDMVTFLNKLASLKTKESLEMIESFIGKGIDIKHLTYDLMVCLKDALVYSNCNDSSILERLNNKQALEILENYTSKQILSVCNILEDAMDNYKQNANHRLFFELCALKIIDVMNPNNVKIVETSTTQVDYKQVDKTVEAVASSGYQQSFVKVNPTIEEKPITPIVKENKDTNPLFSIPEDSEAIAYSTIEYVNILCQGDKKFKEDLTSRWKIIKNYIDNPSTKYVAQMLIDASIGAASKEYLFIVYDYQLLFNKARQKNNIVIIKNFIKEVFGYDLEIYVVDRSTFMDARKLWMDLNQARKLPPIHPIPRLDSKTKENENDDKVIDEQTTNKENNNEEDPSRILFGDDIETE